MGSVGRGRRVCREQVSYAQSYNLLLLTFLPGASTVGVVWSEDRLQFVVRDL